jgi:cytochrome P450
MQWFSALIPAYPEIQKKAQAELDRVVGRDRLPTVEDEKAGILTRKYALPLSDHEQNLPFCHAIIKEVGFFGLDTQPKYISLAMKTQVERCHNPFWLGTPHVTSQDFTYKGHFIPKDTVVVLNTWTMHHDPSRHPEPDSFNPERYIRDSLTSADSANSADPYQRDHWMFGAGYVPYCSYCS